MTILHITSLAIEGLTAGLSLVAFAKNYNLLCKKISLLCIIIFIIEAPFAIWQFEPSIGIPVSLVSTWIIYMTIAHLYAAKIENRLVKKLIAFFMAALTIGIAMQFYLSRSANFYFPLVVAASVFVVFLVGAYFREMLIGDDVTPIMHDPWLWFSLAFFVRYGGVIPLLWIIQYLLRPQWRFSNDYFYFVLQGFSILFNLLLIKGIWSQKNTIITTSY